MIKYNLRYRGPFEYDKFILTIFQFANEVNLLKEEIENGDITLLTNKENDMKKLFDELTNEDGIAQQLLKLKLKVQERGTTN